MASSEVGNWVIPCSLSCCLYVCRCAQGCDFGVGMANPTIHISPKGVDVGLYGGLMVVVMKRNMNARMSKRWIKHANGFCIRPRHI
jgi:hypothetical protein